VALPQSGSLQALPALVLRSVVTQQLARNPPLQFLLQLPGHLLILYHPGRAYSPVSNKWLRRLSLNLFQRCPPECPAAVYSPAASWLQAGSFLPAELPLARKLLLLSTFAKCWCARQNRLHSLQKAEIQGG